MHVTSVIIKQCITLILKNHNNLKHEGVKFGCKLCDYKAS